MNLNNKQIAKLKSIASNKNAIFQVGKNDISDNTIEGITSYINLHEIIKIKVLKNSDEEIIELAKALADKTNSFLVQIIGRNIVLYKKSKKNLLEIN